MSRMLIVPSLHRLLRRAFQLSKALPDELLHVFEKRTVNLPKSTEAERLVEGLRIERSH